MNVYQYRVDYLDDDTDEMVSSDFYLSKIAAAQRARTLSMREAIGEAYCVAVKEGEPTGQRTYRAGQIVETRGEGFAEQKRGRKPRLGFANLRR